MATKPLPDDHHYVVISSDNHAGANLLGYKPYLEKKWHDEFEAWAAEYENPWDFMDPRLDRDDVDANQIEILTGAASWHSPLNWDSDRRLRHMEADGVVGEVIFPNTAPPFMPGSVLSGRSPTSRPEYERRWAGLQAHNRWLVDFCGEVPGRRAGIAQIMLYDVEDAVTEVRRVKTDGLTGGVLLPMDGPLSNSTPLYVDDLEPLWQTCAELDMPLHKHASAPPEQPGADRSGPGVIAVGFAERQFFNHRALAQLVFSGVPERHPTIKIVFSESGAGWIPGHLTILDNLYVNGRGGNGLLSFLAPAMSALSLKPSEYFERNFFVGASLFLPSEAQRRHEIGVDKIMWGVDYPHSEGTFPFSREAMSCTFADIDPVEVDLMLGRTAAKIFNFDYSYLQSVADKCGPTVAEVRTRPASMPRVPEDSMSLVFNSRALADR